MRTLQNIYSPTLFVRNNFLLLKWHFLWVLLSFWHCSCWGLPVLLFPVKPVYFRWWHHVLVKIFLSCCSFILKSPAISCCPVATLLCSKHLISFTHFFFKFSRLLHFKNTVWGSVTNWFVESEFDNLTKKFWETNSHAFWRSDKFLFLFFFFQGIKTRSEMQTLQHHEEKRLISFIEKVTEKVSSLITEKSDYQPNFVCKDSQINFKFGRGESSLHWSICLSFCPFLDSGVC